jgi:hypothetical protein
MKIKSKISVVLCMLGLWLLLGGQAVFADVATAPVAGDITVTNNIEGVLDTIAVSNVASGDIINVYKVEKGGTPIASILSTTSGAAVKISVNQLGKAASKVYITKTSAGNTESARTAVDYSVEPVTTAVTADKVTVTNFPLGELDTIVIDGTALTNGDIIKVYSQKLGGTPIAVGTIANKAVTIYTYQLGAKEGSVYVSVTTAGNYESARTAVTYTAEPVTTAPTDSNTTVTNNIEGTNDTVAVAGVAEGDVVNVYTAKTGGKLLGSVTVAKDTTSAAVSITQLGATKGSVYVGVTTPHKLPSVRLKKDYTAEPISTAPKADSITVTNNKSGTNDTVAVTGLAAGDIVKVYSVATKGTMLGSVTASSGTATVSIAQIATSATSVGSVYVSVTSTAKLESTRTSKTYSSETSAALTAAAITATNATGANDTVVVTGLAEGDLVTVYSVAKDGTNLGTATVGTGSTTATVSLSADLGTKAGSVYVSVTRVGKFESTRLAKAYTATSAGGGGTTGTPVTSVVVSSAQGITYIADAGGTLQMSAGAYPPTATDKTITWSVVNGTGKATINSSGLLAAVANGTVTVKATNPASGVIGTLNIDIQNQPITVASIAVTGDGSATTITTANGTLQMSADVQPSDAADKTIAWTVTNGTGTATISKTGLLTALTNGTVTVRATNALTGVYGTLNITLSNQPAAGPLVSQIYTYNGNINQGHGDKITVSGLNAGDVVKVYDAAFGGKIVTSGTVASGKTTFSREGDFVFPSIGYDDGGTQGGTVYVSVKPSGGTESACTAKDYLRATNSALILDTSHVTNIINNKPGMSDIFTVTGVSEGSVIRAYSYQLNSQAVAIEALVGTTTVPNGQTSVNMSVPEIGPDEGWLRVTQQAQGQEESDKYVLDTINSPKDFISSQTPIALGYCLDNVGTRNYTSAPDELWISNTPVGYVVKVYRTATGNDCFGTFTITNGTTQMFNLSQDLGANEGDIYISLTKSNLTESNRIVRPYNIATENGQ